RGVSRRPRPPLAAWPHSLPTPMSAAMSGSVNGPANGPELGRSGFGPLGGAGAPPRRFALHLPIERDGSTHFVAVDDVVAVHANAHYTFVFNGHDKLFCPPAIGDVESRPEPRRVARAHRSPLRNTARV